MQLTNSTSRFASHTWGGPFIPWAVGFSFLLLYASCLVVLPKVGSPAETIMAILGLVALLTWGGSLRRSAALWLLAAAIAVQVLSWALGYYHHPQWVEDNPQVDRLAKLFIFIAIAWWLGGSTGKTLWVWALALLGLIATSFVGSKGLPHWQQGLQGVRVDFDIRNAQHAGMMFATGLLGLLAFSRRCVYKQRLVAWRVVVWGLALAICLAGVVVTQTRAVWLALAITLPVMGALWMKQSLRQPETSFSRRNILIGVFLLVLVGTTVVILGKDTIDKRLQDESSVIGMVLQGNFSEVPYTSVGIRIQTWRAATEWIAERPLVGWGSDGRSLAIDQTEWLPDWVKRQYGHLHNFFLEVWIAYGALGLAVIGALAVWVGRATWLAWRGGVLPGDMALFGAGFFVYWVIVNQFESYNSFWTGVYVHNLVLGGLVTHYWRWQLMVKERSSEPAQVY
ncbi:O-antigen ligase [Modicisalibacter ilicicola DSM 19980]|uniref:O-antigen ligase n=1 Tax=Modicisalibacter ilicicola DSM 19980 TaxID=1121942 RepID=A0A1M5ENQ9_9GAMM|nr:O-antigen ligase family protein [Halomonas ilicicola]SHF80662.1 O-antigen ligase [Halomonas ilicicola DSM 19980]